MIFPILQSQKGEVTHLRCQLVTCGTKVTQAKVTPPQLQGSAVPFTTVPGGGRGDHHAHSQMKHRSGTQEAEWGLVSGFSPGFKFQLHHGLWGLYCEASKRDAHGGPH